MTGPADGELSARAAQLLYAYARAVDAGDLDTLAGLATADVALTRADGTRHGRAAFLALYRGFRDSGVLASKHAVTNVQAYREDGGLVRAVAYFTATMFEPDRTRLVFGEYADSLCEVDGALRLVHKRIRVERLVDLPVSSADWPGATPVLDGSVKE